MAGRENRSPHEKAFGLDFIGGFRPAGGARSRSGAGRRRLDPRGRHGRAFRPEYYHRPGGDPGPAPGHRAPPGCPPDDQQSRALRRGLCEGRGRLAGDSRGSHGAPGTAHPADQGDRRQGHGDPEPRHAPGLPGIRPPRRGHGPVDDGEPRLFRARTSSGASSPRSAACAG